MLRTADDRPAFAPTTLNNHFVYVGLRLSGSRFILDGQNVRQTIFQTKFVGGQAITIKPDGQVFSALHAHSVPACR